MQAPSYLIKIGNRFYAQVRVPSDIAESYGRKQHKKSLKTNDHDTAVDRLHSAGVEIKAEFAKHRASLLRQKQEPAPVPAPTPQSFADLGRQYGREIAERELTIRADLYEEAVARPKEFWRGAAQKFSEPDQFTYFDKLMADGDLDRVVGYIIRKRSEDRIADLKRMIDTGDMGEVLALAEERQPGLDRKAHVALALTLARAEIAALQNSLSGDLEGHRTAPAQTSASASIPVSTTPALPPVSLDALFDKWKAETKPSASTLSTWRGIIKSLKAAFPEKADDASSLTPEDMIKWKDDLVESGKAAKTINDSYFACVRTIFGYGVNNRLVTANPGIGVKTARGRKASKTRFGYTNAGAARLLELARKETKPTLRWLPWLAAQTGSRISEVAQLWGSFVKEEDGIPYLDIKRAPDGGSIKETFSERTVPLHPQLIADGFLDFVKSKGDGPLFYGKSSGDPEKKHASKGVSTRLAAWIRENGFTDKRIDPNHGLRHWFKTHADDVGIQDRMADRLQGHATKTDAGGYYNPELSTMLTALKKIKLPPVSAGGDELDKASGG
ncbi:DUF6538 domain-containing protein [Mesorhizobium sp.]|uniref:DUF6538 domain-containing protein n=1 Tax=Mesorhizobium sp. TaxID=1871066 RepID=UPI00257B5DC5|nr:DUF6538 domain-containing protein [Mesorhizobium sp.]